MEIHGTISQTSHATVYVLIVLTYLRDYMIGNIHLVEILYVYKYIYL